ncbi:MAG: glycosyltransferase family 2 protein [Erysipelotrichaceae bacterium]|nr:glycosyltransferase family 2 protein [Erysipelotrichaceae bacterium]
MDNNGLPLVSVILPIYNVEKYLARCLDSVVSQTYHNLEIILVDDGSTDGSGSIAERYAETDKRITVYHKKNGGLSSARNYGIDRCNGEYLTFIDSDDYVESDYVSYLFELLNNQTYKLSICSIYNDFEDSGRVVDNGDHTKRILSAKEAIEMMCYHDLVDTCAYAKMYHRDLFKDVRYPEGKLFEDIGTTYLLFDQNEAISCGFESKYHYVIRRNSIVTGQYNPKKLDLLEMTDQMADYVASRYPDLKEAVLRRRVYARFSTLNQLLDVKGNEDTKSGIVSFIKANAQSVLRDPKTPKRDRAAFYMLRLGLPVYKLFWNAYKVIKK